MNLLIDLFAGLGGASEAFRNRENWDVLCIDNNPDLLPHIITGNRTYIIGDITDRDWVIDIISAYGVWDSYDKVVIWASPPCDQWSNGYNSQKSECLRSGKQFIPDYSCLDATKYIIDNVQAYCETMGITFIYCIENVRGGIQFINERLNLTWRQQAGQMFLWGNFPLLSVKEALASHVKPDSRHSPIRANIRAKVPYEASKAFYLAIKNQTKLF